MTRGWRNVACLALCSAATPSLALAQHLGGASAFEPPLLRLVLGLLLCTLIAVVAALAIRRFMRVGGFAPAKGRLSFLHAAPRKLRVIESHRLSPHADVCMFACDGREYLVVVTAGGATVLSKEARAEEARP